jgi:ribose transport system permease protein
MARPGLEVPLAGRVTASAARPSGSADLLRQRQPGLADVRGPEAQEGIQASRIVGGAEHVAIGPHDQRGVPAVVREQPFLTDLTAATGTTLGFQVPPVVVIWGVVAIIVAVLLYRTAAGRRLYATGANPRAAALVNIKTRWVWVSVFAASAIISALVGCLLAGFAGADQSIGDPYLFSGLTAVIVGGTTFMGARGDYTHTVVGALMLTVLTTVLVGKGYDQADQQIIFGLLILLVVAGYGRDRRLRDRI